RDGGSIRPSPVPPHGDRDWAGVRGHSTGGGAGRGPRRRPPSGVGETRRGRVRSGRQAAGAADGAVSSRVGRGPGQSPGRRAGAGVDRRLAPRAPRRPTGAPAGLGMIAYLRGRVLRRMEETLVVECGGVGYEVHLPGFVQDALRGAARGEGDTVELHISYHV